jgi:hypothetical protein
MKASMQEYSGHRSHDKQSFSRRLTEARTGASNNERPTECNTRTLGLTRIARRRAA